MSRTICLTLLGSLSLTVLPGEPRAAAFYVRGEASLVYGSGLAFDIRSGPIFGNKRGPTNVGLDRSVLFPRERHRVCVRVLGHPAEALESSRNHTITVFSPRAWSTLTPDHRSNPRGHEGQIYIPGGRITRAG